MSKISEYDEYMKEIYTDINEKAEADAAFLDELILDHLAMKEALEFFAGAPLVGHVAQEVLDNLNVVVTEEEVQ